MFWIQFGKLLIQTDIELHEQLQAEFKRHNYGPLPYKLLNDYEAKALKEVSK